MGYAFLSTATAHSTLPLCTINKKPFSPVQAVALPPLARSGVQPSGASLSYGYNPMRFPADRSGSMLKLKENRRCGPVCYASPISHPNLQWISIISSAVLMLTKGTAIQKSFLVPLFALLAPGSVISWIKGDYGMWSAFLALLVRLFYFIPGELELPFLTLVLVIVAPNQVMHLRGKQEGAIVSLVIAGYLAYQHFSRASYQRAFEQNSIVATIAIICIAVACIFLLI